MNFDQWKDSLTGTADEFEGGELWAKSPVSIYTRPMGTFVKSIPAGGYVGKIFTYQLYNGNVWWMLEDGKYVAHETGKFDNTKLFASLWEQYAAEQKKIDEKAQERIDNHDGLDFMEYLEKLFSGFFKALKGPMIMLLVVIAVIFLLSKKI